MTSLTVSLRQPVQVATSLRSDGVIDTVDHIPGWVVRGALAAAWIRTNGLPDQPARRARFVELFEGGVRFGPLFHAEAPPPLSVHQHKYKRTAACTDQYLDAAARPDLKIPFTCPDCHQEWVPLRPKSDLPTHVRTSVVIDPLTATAAKGLLFSRRRKPARISDPSAPGGSTAVTLSGNVSGPAASVQELATLTGVRLGGRRTSHGAVTLSQAPATPPEPWIRNDGILVLRLVSPAVFVDDSGRPSSRPSDRELSDVLGVSATTLAGWSRWGAVGGWHAASGLPKPTETVVEAGSTYAVRLACTPTDAAVRALMDRGIGLRRHEGFGHLGERFVVAQGEVDQETLSEAATALTDEALLPFRSLASGGQMSPELAGAIRAALADPGLADAAAELARAQGGALTGARDAEKVRKLLALSPVMSAAIVTRLEKP